MSKPALRLIQQTAPSAAEKVRQRVRKAPKPATMLQCNRCAGREVLETKTGVLFKDGKTTGGKKQVLCALCFSKGERVVLA